MHPVDALHQLLRHTCSHHRRETIAFGRRMATVMLGAFLTTVWKNFVKGRSERKPDPRTPAMVLGLTDEPWTWRRVLAKRLFPSRVVLPEGWIETYRMLWVTPPLGRNRIHDLKYAF